MTARDIDVAPVSTLYGRRAPDADAAHADG
jgi:hypothetical protein